MDAAAPDDVRPRISAKKRNKIRKHGNKQRTKKKKGSSSSGSQLPRPSAAFFFVSLLSCIYFLRRENQTRGESATTSGHKRTVELQLEEREPNRRRRRACNHGGRRGSRATAKTVRVPRSEMLCEFELHWFCKVTQPRSLVDGGVKEFLQTWRLMYAFTNVGQ